MGYYGELADYFILDKNSKLWFKFPLSVDKEKSRPGIASIKEPEITNIQISVSKNSTIIKNMFGK